MTGKKGEVHLQSTETLYISNEKWRRNGSEAEASKPGSA